MAYTPTEWKCGDTVTAEKLNKLENAVADLSESGGGTADVEIVRYYKENPYSSEVLCDHAWEDVQVLFRSAMPVKYMYYLSSDFTGGKQLIPDGAGVYWFYDGRTPSLGTIDFGFLVHYDDRIVLEKQTIKSAT